MTLWEFTKDRWSIKKKEIVAMGINPNKEYSVITWGDLENLASELDVTVGEFIEY